ncbi:MAG TPA: hypothetical protein V6C86_22035 [Oculatellaceae cyanobacterium]
MSMLKTENDYLAVVRRAEIEFGPNHVQTGDALVELAKFYERVGLLDAANDCYDRMNGILERYYNAREGERFESQT